MPKKRFIFFTIILLILTNLLTFSLTNFITIQNDSRVILPKKEYDQLYSSYQNYSKVHLLERMIKSDYLGQVNDEDLFEGQLKGMVQALDDPYSQYLTKDEFKDLTEQTSGSFGGIGIIVTPGDDNLITIVSPVEDTPGERAGLKSGDKILKVDGQEFTGETMDKAVKAMKGEPNSQVELTIMRQDEDGKNENFDVEIIREIIKLVTVKSQMLDDKIGYINITSFDEQTYGDFSSALKKLESDKAKGLIIDLRNNPGGLLTSTTKIADELLGEGIIVYTEGNNGEKSYYKSSESHSDLPLVVLVNKGSASASEILAGAIKDYDRGLIVGTQTFGKGLVQNMKPLSDGSGLKLTISEYFTPKGTNIHNIGVEPDIVLELPDDIKGIGLDYIEEDVQLLKAIELINSQ